MDLRAEQILDFWFADTAWDPACIRGRVTFWFGAEGETREAAMQRDELIRARFRDAVEAASDGGLSRWADEPRERLALILLLDQFRRNIYRGTKAAFARDEVALALTQSGRSEGMDQRLAPIERAFFLMPLQHAESLAAQEQSVAAFAELEAEAPPRVREVFETFTEDARLHHDIVRRFGRFPHRDAILGRAPTAEETRYLAGEAPRFGQ